MVEYFRKIFLTTPYLSFYHSLTGHYTWWKIKNNTLYLGRYINHNKPMINFIVVPATYQRIDKSKELMDILKDDKW